MSIREMILVGSLLVIAGIVIGLSIVGFPTINSVEKAGFFRDLYMDYLLYCLS